MNHEDHVNLLRAGVPAHMDREPGNRVMAHGGADPVPAAGRGAVWADLGAGAGAFTLALADLLGPGAEIYAIDRDAGALREQAPVMAARFPATAVHYVTTDFTRGLDLPALDGVVMANALHFLPDGAKPGMLARIRDYLKPGGRLILVEYNADRGNPWVPYPLSYPTWAALAARCGFGQTWLLATVPSRFLGEIYSALSCR